MFRGVTLKEFNERFSTDDDCREYLFNIKWIDGFACHHCGHKKSYPGKTRFHQRCQRCEYDESATAQTIFHKIKFPLLKAFGIAFLVSVRKKGMSTLELSRTFAINQKTAWLFKRKIQEAVKSSFVKEKKGASEIFNIEFGGAELEPASRFEAESQIAEIVLSRDKDFLNGFGTIIKEEKLNPESSVTDERKNSSVGESSSATENGEVNKIENETNPTTLQPANKHSVVILNLKTWIRGIHHHCSARFAQGYLDEFFYRFNMRNSLKLIWHGLISRLMGGKPYFYRPTMSKWLIESQTATTLQSP